MGYVFVCDVALFGIQMIHETRVPSGTCHCNHESPGVMREGKAPDKSRLDNYDSPVEGFSFFELCSINKSNLRSGFYLWLLDHKMNYFTLVLTSCLIAS